MLLFPVVVTDVDGRASQRGLRSHWKKRKSTFPNHFHGLTVPFRDVVMSDGTGMGVV